MNYMIKEMDEEIRPRERLKRYGAEALGNDEVLAILLRCGTKECNVKDLSVKILNEIDGMKNFSNISWEKLSKIKGVGEVKALTLLAALEFGKRVLAESNKETVKMINSKTIYELFKYKFVGVMQEMLVAVFLDVKNNLISSKTIFMGTINKSVVHPREVFKEAVSCGAGKIVLIHNHPSGNPKPSFNDEVFTEKMVKLGVEMDIPVIEHIIIGKGAYYSITNHKEYKDEEI